MECLLVGFISFRQILDTEQMKHQASKGILFKSSFVLFFSLLLFFIINLFNVHLYYRT